MLSAGVAVLSLTTVGFWLWAMRAEKGWHDQMVENARLRSRLADEVDRKRVKQ